MAKDGNLATLIKNDMSGNQYDYFMRNHSNGLTTAGLSRLNQRIEAIVYCVLGAQVNTRSASLGNEGSAKETQSEFLTLMEDAIRGPEISKSFQRLQLAIDEAKVRLDLAVSPDSWLMPSDLEINTQSVTGYNNDLKKATADMKLGVNDSVSGGESKIKRPTSHPSNPIHRSVNDSEKQSSGNIETQNLRNSESRKATQESESSHEMLKAGVFIAAAVSAFLIYRMK